MRQRNVGNDGLSASELRKANNIQSNKKGFAKQPAQDNSAVVLAAAVIGVVIVAAVIYFSMM